MSTKDKPVFGQWQPIETAPKDRAILVWFSAMFGGKLDIARWEECRFAKNPKPYWGGSQRAIFGVSAYRDGKPTHWMPLPPPPEPAP